jgi:hypothetical protein
MHMKIVLARCVSILGHPLLLMPAATIGLAMSRNASGESMRSLVLVLVAVVAVASAFSIWNVRSGRWAHIDASNPSERKSLNWALAAVLLTVSAVTWRSHSAREIAIGFLACGLAVIVVLILSPALKISLHTCFAAIAAGLFWPDLLPVTVGIFIVAAVAWSRLVLHRHTAAEVLLGALVGSASAIGYHALAG